MTDLRVQHSESAPERPLSVSRDGSGSQRQPGQEATQQQPQSRGAEELAVALAESDRGDSLTAQFELDERGNPLIRITDRARHETVALITPEELKALAEDTGLPPGLLVQVSS